MSLMAAVMDYFHTCEIEYQPESLYYDISKCIGQYYIIYLIIIMKKNPYSFKEFVFISFSRFGSRYIPCWDSLKSKSVSTQGNKNKINLKALTGNARPPIIIIDCKYIV